VLLITYRVRKPDGAWMQKTEKLDNCKDKKSAQKELDRRLSPINAANGIDPRSGPSPLFSELLTVEFQLYLGNRDLKPSTRYSYDNVIKTWISPEFGDRPLTEIRPVDVSRFMSKLIAKGMTAKTRRNVYCLLRVIFDVAVDNDLIPGSPVRPKLHRPKIATEEKPMFSFEQAKKLLDAVPADWRASVLTLALTGIRAGELRGLQWQDIDFLAKRLMIRRSVWRKQIVTPKTQASKRTLAMSEQLVGILMEHRQKAQFSDPDDFVFCQADATPIDPDSLRRLGIKPAMEAAGIPHVARASGCHAFRHLAASLIHKRTGSLKMAQKQLGHTTIAMTGNVYTHVDEESMEEAARVLGELFENSCCTVVVQGAPGSDRVQ